MNEAEAILKRRESVVSDIERWAILGRHDSLPPLTTVEVLDAENARHIFEVKSALRAAVDCLEAQERRVARLEAFVRAFIAFYPDCAQLLTGWHQDGTDWTEWDQSVYDALIALSKEARTALEPGEDNSHAE